MFFVLPQWINYSFVGVSNKTAIHFRKVFMKSNALDYKTLCIINHNEGSWPTEEGKIVRFFTDKKFDIVSIKEEDIPAQCTKKDALVLKNEGTEYSIIELK